MDGRGKETGDERDQRCPETVLGGDQPSTPLGQDDIEKTREDNGHRDRFRFADAFTGARRAAT